MVRNVQCFLFFKDNSAEENSSESLNALADVLNGFFEVAQRLKVLGVYEVIRWWKIDILSTCSVFIEINLKIIILRALAP